MRPVWECACTVSVLLCLLSAVAATGQSSGILLRGDNAAIRFEDSPITLSRDGDTLAVSSNVSVHGDISLGAEFPSVASTLQDLNQAVFGGQSVATWQTYGSLRVGDVTRGFEGVSILGLDSSLKDFKGRMACHEQYCYMATFLWYLLPRLDSAKPVDLPSAYTWLDINSLGQRHFSGCVAGPDGTIYYPPLGDGSATSHLMMLNTSAGFSLSSISFLNLASTNSALKGFYGGHFSNGWLYLAPYGTNAAAHGKMTRVQRDINNATNFTVEWVDFADQNGDLVGYRDSCSDDNGWVYAAPHTDDNVNAVRVSENDFSLSSVETIALDGVDSDLNGFSAAVYNPTTDFLYLVPYGFSSRLGLMACINVTDFTDTGVAVIRIENLSSPLVGFLGAVFLDGFLYLAQFRDLSGFAGRLVRVDVSDPSNVDHNLVVSYSDPGDLINANLAAWVGGTVHPSGNSVMFVNMLGYIVKFSV